MEPTIDEELTTALEQAEEPAADPSSAEAPPAQEPDATAGDTGAVDGIDWSKVKPEDVPDDIALAVARPPEWWGERLADKSRKEAAKLAEEIVDQRLAELRKPPEPEPVVPETPTDPDVVTDAQLNARLAAIPGAIDDYGDALTVENTDPVYLESLRESIRANQKAQALLDARKREQDEQFQSQATQKQAAFVTALVDLAGGTDTQIAPERVKRIEDLAKAMVLVARNNGQPDPEPAQLAAMAWAATQDSTGQPEPNPAPNPAAGLTPAQAAERVKAIEAEKRRMASGRPAAGAAAPPADSVEVPAGLEGDALTEWIVRNEFKKAGIEA